MEILGITITHVQVFLLVLARIAGLFFVAPVFGSPAVPRQVKVWLAALTALIFVPGVMHGVGGDVAALRDMLSHPLRFVCVLVTQCMTGFLIGFAANLVFVGIQMAGELIDLQVGFATINLLNPLVNHPVSVVANLYHFVAVLLFMTFNGHHWLLMGIGHSLQLVPLTEGGVSAGAVAHLTALFAGTLTIAVQVAAPAVGALLLADVVLGLMARTLPQMNVFVVGLPLKVAVGLGVLMVSLPYWGGIIQSLLQGMPGELLRLMRQ